jgi:hypothetical protein
LQENIKNGTRNLWKHSSIKALLLVSEKHKRFKIIVAALESVVSVAPQHAALLANASSVYLLGNFYMGNRKTTLFCKQAVCPSAETLLSYQAANLSCEQEVSITLHLVECDFCCAELHLLSHNEQADVCCTQTAEIPTHLRRLAESLLGDYYFRNDFFPDVIFEREDLSFTDA